MFRVLVEQFGIGHAHENQMIHASRPGGIDGVTALPKLHVGVGLGRSEVVGDHKDLFCPRLRECTVQIRTDRVVANHGLHTLVRQRAVGRPCGAIDLEARFEQCPADVASNLPGGIEDQNLFSGHTQSFRRVERRGSHIDDV